MRESQSEEVENTPSHALNLSQLPRAPVILVRTEHPSARCPFLKLLLSGKDIAYVRESLDHPDAIKGEASTPS
jgi:hypothetical protein